MSRVYDIAVVGSGFAGSLMAMIAHRMGRSVVLLERGRHPRFAIGESSTPLSNLLLDDLATRYDLPRLKPLAKWGSWQRSYPHPGCGLKRGFTFYHHDLDQPRMTHSLDQLLVAASPRDEIADTHWYRADFDAMLVEEAQKLGIDYFDEVSLDKCIERRAVIRLEGSRIGREIAFNARFVVDATGPRGFLHRTLKLPEAKIPGYPSTQALYNHFSGVGRLEQVQARPSEGMRPYPADDAAVHHVFDGGWIWVLHFNNGITSAGVAATDIAAARLRLIDGEVAWGNLLRSIPALEKQFARAKAIQPFKQVSQLSFMSGIVCGERWAMLPSAAGFVDPLLSTGFPLALLGIERLAHIFEHDWNAPVFALRLQQYASQTTEELQITGLLIASLYANMNNFSVFAALTLLYFAAASYSETARRLQKPQLAPSFLLLDHPTFGPASKGIFDYAQHPVTAQQSATLIEAILKVIEPIDVAGLSNRQRRNCYPVDPEDLLRSAHKLGVTRGDIEQMLHRCAFYGDGLNGFTE